MSIQDVLAVAGLLVAAIGVPAAVAAWRSDRSAVRHQDFTRVLNHLEVHQQELEELALQAEASYAADPVPLLTRPGWILSEPRDLGTVRLTWQTAMPPTVGSVDSLRARAAAVLGRLPLPGQPRYLSALVTIAGYRFFDGVTYRLTHVESDGSDLQLAFTRSSYFEFLDTCEILAYEAAAQHLRGKPVVRGRLRRDLADPFDLTNRVAGLGIVTLTLRVDGSSSQFFMHRRDGQRVAVAASQYHVVPAGEFTPADVSHEAVTEDFDLWKNVVREYAEEFLGAEDAQGRGGRRIDYDHDLPYAAINRARATGRARCFVLGVGLGPLDWKPDLITVCVFTADAFDEVFAGMVSTNDEGTLVVGRHSQGIPFVEARVNGYAHEADTRFTGRAALLLAWEHRDRLTAWAR